MAQSDRISILGCRTPFVRSIIPQKTTASFNNRILPRHKQATMSDQNDIPTGEFQDNEYQSRTGQNQVPVQSDNKPVEDPIDGNVADSDAQLERDDNEAINKGNMINERTRGAAKSGGTYQEPGDEEGLPGPDDGTSRVTGSGV
ncbi:hypothetical protein WHR41_02131 [Cladosporium halotolerans]|uniref:Histone chaperone domain-containing protein n=1 Tax=Cladosporium halotolerans TaxID=1052096 RepID=A0AB34KZH9_9PEZI